MLNPVKQMHPRAQREHGDAMDYGNTFLVLESVVGHRELRIVIIRQQMVAT